MKKETLDCSTHLHMPLRRNPMNSLATGGPGSHGAQLGLMVEAWEAHGGYGMMQAWWGCCPGCAHWPMALHGR